MATQVQNAKAVVDALADSLGKTVTTQQATDIVEEFINQVGGAGSTEEKATTFNDMLINIIRSTGQAHVGQIEENSHDAAIAAARAGAASNI